VLAQLVERYSSKRTWARDLWHLSSRWLRISSDTMAVLLCQQPGLSSLNFQQQLIASWKNSHTALARTPRSLGCGRSRVWLQIGDQRHRRYPASAPADNYACALPRLGANPRHGDGVRPGAVTPAD
jgi:hypothetical protein